MYQTRFSRPLLIAPMHDSARSLSYSSTDARCSSAQWGGIAHSRKRSLAHRQSTDLYKRKKNLLPIIFLDCIYLFASATVFVSSNANISSFNPRHPSYTVCCPTECVLTNPPLVVLFLHETVFTITLLPDCLLSHQLHCHRNSACIAALFMRLQRSSAGSAQNDDDAVILHWRLRYVQPIQPTSQFECRIL